MESEMINTVSEDDIQTAKILVEIHNQGNVNDSEATVTADESECENSQPTPGQGTPKEPDLDTDDSMMCEAAADVETATPILTPTEFSQLTEIMDHENETSTTFRVNKRTNAPSTDDDTGDSDSQVGLIGRFVSGIFGSTEPKVKNETNGKKKPKQQKLEEEIV